jgi:hypothetical protein
MVGGPGSIGIEGFEIEAVLIPILGLSVARRVRRGCERFDGGRQDGIEVEEDLPRLGIPQEISILSQDPSGVCGETDLAQLPVGGHLMNQLSQCIVDPSAWQP